MCSGKVVYRDFLCGLSWISGCGVRLCDDKVVALDMVFELVGEEERCKGVTFSPIRSDGSFASGLASSDKDLDSAWGLGLSSCRRAQLGQNHG